MSLRYKLYHRLFGWTVRVEYRDEEETRVKYLSGVKSWRFGQTLKECWTTQEDGGWVRIHCNIDHTLNFYRGEWDCVGQFKLSDIIEVGGEISGNPEFMRTLMLIPKK